MDPEKKIIRNNCLPFIKFAATNLINSVIVLGNLIIPEAVLFKKMWYQTRVTTSAIALIYSEMNDT